MKKSYMVIGIVVCLVIVVSFITYNQISPGNAKKTVSNLSDTAENNNGEEITEKNPVEGKNMKLNGKDLQGNKIDESIFKDKKITLVNIWATTCGPCVEEIPELQKFADEYKDKVNVVGIVADGENMKDAEELLKEKKITYSNIAATKDMDDVLGKFDYVPVTLFVDSEGKILKEFIPGGTEAATLKKIVDKMIK